MDKLLRSLHYLFHDTPARLIIKFEFNSLQHHFHFKFNERLYLKKKVLHLSVYLISRREDFSTLTKSSVFPIPFCVSKNESGILQLKKDHQYFYQIQTQLHVYEKTYCDFVVWGKDLLHNERILPNTDFWDLCALSFSTTDQMARGLCNPVDKLAHCSKQPTTLIGYM